MINGRAVAEKNCSVCKVMYRQQARVQGPEGNIPARMIKRSVANQGM